MPKQLKILWLLLILAAVSGVAGLPLSNFLHSLFGGGFFYFVNGMVILCLLFFLVAIGLGLYYVNQRMINENQFAVFLVASFLLGGITLFWVVFVLI